MRIALGSSYPHYFRLTLAPRYLPSFFVPSISSIPSLLVQARFFRLSDDQKMAQGMKEHSNLYKAIKLDHDNVRDLGERFVHASVAERARIVNVIVREITIHNISEEIAIYPHFVKYLGEEVGWPIYVKSREDHHCAKKKLLEVADLCFDRPHDTFTEKVNDCVTTFNAHAVEEENDILPKFELAVGKPDVLEEFKDHFLNVRNVAPSRPHPVDPTDAPREIVALLSFAVLDKVGDKERFFAPLKYQHTEEY